MLRLVWCCASGSSAGWPHGLASPPEAELEESEDGSAAANADEEG